MNEEEKKQNGIWPSANARTQGGETCRKSNKETMTPQALTQLHLQRAYHQAAQSNSLLMAQVLSSAAAAAANQHLFLQQQITHNLIPKHLKAQTLTASLDGTPGYQPALILPQLAAAAAANNPMIPLTVQDCPMIPPVYNGINVQCPGLRLLHRSPPIYTVENFLTPQECDFLVAAASDSFEPAPIVGKGLGEISPSRTSSTCYLAREDVPQYMRKVQLLTGKPMEHFELPQVGRYLPTQKYLQHYDAFNLGDEDGRRFAANGGQRVVTVLVYLNSPQHGGATHFPNLNLSVQPKQGSALVFFPATVDGLLDKAVLHAALPAVDPKYVSQVWVRQSNYTGTARKRLPQTMGIPDYTPPSVMDVLQWKAAANLM